MTDEEKKAIEIVKGITEDDLLNYWEGPEEPYNAIQIILNLIKKQSKEIEELKEDRKSYTEEYIHNNPWLYKQLNELYIFRMEADELCNKKWEDKIKAKIEEYENKIKKIRSKKLINEPEDTIIITRYAHYISVLQSLLEKE